MHHAVRYTIYKDNLYAHAFHLDSPFWSEVGKSLFSKTQRIFCLGLAPIELSARTPIRCWWCNRIPPAHVYHRSSPWLKTRVSDVVFSKPKKRDHWVIDDNWKCGSIQNASETRRELTRMKHNPNMFCLSHCGIPPVSHPYSWSQRKCQAQKPVAPDATPHGVGWGSVHGHCLFACFGHLRWGNHSQWQGEDEKKTKQHRPTGHFLKSILSYSIHVPRI